MAKVTTVFASDDKEVMAAIQKMNAEMAKLRDQNKKLAEESKKGGQQSAGMMEVGIAQAAKLAAGYLSVQTAVQAVTAALHDKFDIEKRSLELQTRTAVTQRDFLANLGTTTRTQKQGALASISAISKRTGVAESNLYGPGSSALSAAGGVENLGVAMTALEKAARIAPDSAEAMSQIAGAIIDLNKATGSLQGEKGLDLLIGLQAGSRVKNMGLLASNVPRGVAGATASGFSPEAAAALFESLSNAMADDKGALTATAESSLAARLRAYLPENDVYAGEGRNRKLKHKGVGAMSGEGRFAMVSEDEKLRTGFLDSLEQSEAKPFIELLMTPGTRENKMYKESLIKYRGMKPGGAEEFIKGLNDTELQQVANLDRGGAAITEGRFLQDQTGATSASVKKQIDELGKTLGLNVGRRFIDARTLDANSLAGADPAASGLKILKAYERAEAERTEGGPRMFVPMNQQEIANAQSENLTAIREMVKQLQRIADQRPANANQNVEAQ